MSVSKEEMARFRKDRDYGTLMDRMKLTTADVINNLKRIIKATPKKMKKNGITIDNQLRANEMYFRLVGAFVEQKKLELTDNLDEALDLIEEREKKFSLKKKERVLLQ